MKPLRHRLAFAALLLTAFTPPARAQVAGTLEAWDAKVGGDSVAAMAVQPDGKMIIGRDFTTVGGTAQAHIARLHADGSVDASFTTSTDGDVDCVAVQADGKIVLGGWFTKVNGKARNRIARLHADGSLDASFAASTDEIVECVAVQADGKLVLGGHFTKVNGTTRNRIARLHADGSVDASFTASIDGMVASVAVQADGKIVVVGNFYSVNGTTRTRIARLHADGSLESSTTFNPGTGASRTVLSVAVQADGKLVLGGYFTRVNGTARNAIARLHADGSVDASFTASTDNDGTVLSVAVQADGKIVMAGGFEGVNGTARSRIARLHADGSVESTATFDPGTGAGGTAFGLALQADGRLVLGGYFTEVNGAARNAIARLANDPAPQKVSAPDATQVQWSRGGSAPEVGPVTFELSTNGGTVWTPLGAGTRIGTTANWQLTGLSLPASGHLRARGRTSSGNQSASSGLVETVGTFP